MPPYGDGVLRPFQAPRLGMLPFAVEVIERGFAFRRATEIPAGRSGRAPRAEAQLDNTNIDPISSCLAVLRNFYALSVRNVTRFIPVLAFAAGGSAILHWTGGFLLVLLMLATRRWAKSEVITERLSARG